MENPEKFYDLMAKAISSYGFSKNFCQNLLRVDSDEMFGLDF